MVVLPHPGAPAMILKESSGRPPPRISSSPGTPVGNLLIFTLLSWGIFVFSRGFRIRNCYAGPHPGHDAQCHAFPDERRQQPKQLGCEDDAGFPLLMFAGMISL